MTRVRPYLLVFLLVCVPTTLFSQSALQKLRDKAKQKLQQAEGSVGSANSSSTNAAASPTSPTSSAPATQAPATTPATQAPATQASAGSATPAPTAHRRGHDQASDRVLYGPGRALWCMFTPSPPNHLRELYYSEAFETNVLSKTVQKPFIDYVSAKYSIQGDARCGEFANLDAAEDKLKIDITNDGASYNKIKAIQTGWKFDASQVPVPDDNKAMTAEVDRSKRYCSNNALLGTLYDCSCFADRMLAYRKANGMIKPFINAVQDVVLDPHFRECVGTGIQASTYASKRAVEVLKSDPQYSGKLDVISSCTGDGFAKLLLAKPVANTVYVDGYFNTSLNRCVQKTP